MVATRTRGAIIVRHNYFAWKNASIRRFKDLGNNWIIAATEQENFNLRSTRFEMALRENSGYLVPSCRHVAFKESVALSSDINQRNWQG